MADPDVPPEVNPTRRDPDEPEPNIPVRFVDFILIFNCIYFKQ
jgi:hypothetical protein